ncbi:DNA mismatch repair protein MutS [uncultured Treponema sp.]|uniref:DNA mismatch repair protein MutS n=1 Tax=uncultured Treponema sp. TaxID=162155 RepID=UPI002804B8C2|nr:DNA mismatch repair protein MutS [uncultured Treponema sp.]
MAEETPVITQYLGIKKQHPNDVLFFRLGDFYEMFNEDALEVSRLLNLTLTHKGDNPMCGIPYHSAKGYIARLLRMGKKVAVAEQVGEVAKRGLTERKVVEVVTPGTAVESEYLDGGSNNFLASIFISGGFAGLAYIDVTTGEFRATKFPEYKFAENVSKELGRCSPKEIILPESLKNNKEIQTILETISVASVSWYPDWHFNAEKNYEHLVKQFKVANLNSFSLTKESPEVPPAGFLLDYIEKTTNAPVSHISGISVYQDSQFVIIDDSSRRNLEITFNLRDGTSSYTLLESVSNTKTAMGSRLLRSWLSFPLTNENEINSRQNHVELFVKDRNLLHCVRENLDGILDVERLAGRIAMDRAHAKDLQALKASLKFWLKSQAVLERYDFSMPEKDSAQKIIDLIENSIAEDPATVFTEGRIIKDGWSEELDYWKKVRNDFNGILEEYIESEKEKTGIQNLKIKSTGNLGYFIEVTKGKLDKIPPHFIMRRTLLNAERYTTEKLQELENSLNESGAKILELEHNLFIEVRNELKKYIPYLQQAAKKIAYVDVVCSFAESAILYNWNRPHVLADSLEFSVKNGRHPVVERHLPAGEFVPNDVSLCGSEPENSASFALITGPNMAGKSTFLRQNALIALLAQTGSFVPADEANIGIVDRIFCRVGASDNLARGESTFLVEMTETARILRSATQNSLVIMDEVGRGTSTEDGLSIAWAVSEYLLNTLKCKTFFATHYHELTRLEHKSLKRLCMAVAENGSDIVFLRKVVEGSSENSYGIHVARLAGIPESVIERAGKILEKIQGDASVIIPETETEEVSKNKVEIFSGSLFSEEELVLDEILSCDIDNMTPMVALQNILRWKKSLAEK